MVLFPCEILSSSNLNINEKILCLALGATIFAISAIAWAMTSAGWGRASDKYGRRNIAILGLVGYAISMVADISCEWFAISMVC